MKLTEEELKYARQEAKERIREKIATRKEQFENFKNDPSIASKIVKNRDHIMKVFIVLFVICLISTLFVKVNYDLTEYLPEDVTSKKAIDIMEEEFGYPGTARILIEDVSIYEAELYKEMIEDVEGVDMVAWMSSDVYMSGDFIEADDQTDYYKNNCAVMDVTFEKGDTDELTKDAIDEIKKILGEKGHYGGPAVENKSLEETLNVQIAIITVIAVIMIFIILCLTTNSWAEPVLFLIVGVAIILNMGTNLILGTISFISNSVAAILQLAISIDYSIFLLHTYIKEQKTEPNREKAMTNALKHAALSILSSGMTTFVGFMALLFMRFSIGKDIGIVLGKSIICSILTVMLLMPSLILRFEPLIERTQHKTIIPSFKKPAKFIFKLRYFIVGLIIVVALPTFLMQNSNVNTFGNSALGASEGTVVYEDEQMIESLFGRSNLYLIMVPNGSPVMERELAGELKEAMKEAQSDSVVYFMPPGLHRDPKVLHHYVQDKIDHFYNVSKIVVCTTGCGGGNIGITASSAPLVYPKTRDCIDILLSGDSLADLKRDMHGVFLTESWMEFMKESSIDMEKLEKKMGRDEAHGYLKKLYAPIHDFYIIDTGCYDVEPVKKYIEPMVDLLQADLHMVHGGYGILRKMAKGTFDDDFFVVPKGEKVKPGSFPANF